MKQNKLTPGSNIMWESSRMMLPQHVEEIRRDLREQNRKNKPELDAQEAETIERAIHASFKLKQPVNLSMFDEYEDVRVVGIVERVDGQCGRFKVDGEWFNVADVIGTDAE